MRFFFIGLILLVIQVNFVFGQKELSGNKYFATKNQISEADKIKVFNNLWEIINRQYFDSTFNGHDWVKLREIYQPKILAANGKLEFQRILQNLLNELKTSHLEINTEISLNGKTLDGMFGKNVNYKQNRILFGNGLTTTNYGDLTIVTAVQKQSAADIAGIKVGWIQKSCVVQPFAEIKDEFAIISESFDCVFSTETEPNKRVKFAKNWYLQPIPKLQREIRVLPNNILYLKFSEFDKGLGKWFQEQITKNSSAKAVIVDLRANRGGLVDETKACLSIFFPPKTEIGKFVERDLDNIPYIVGSTNAFKGQAVVLIDGNSTSGAEVFAAAFQDLERGKVIGYKSSGKVLNSLDKSLSNGFQLRFAFRDYKTIKGHRIENNGVTPDIKIPFSIEDFRQPKDVILEKTLDYLQTLTIL